MTRQGQRDEELKLVIMSATLDAAAFVRFFPGAKSVYLQVQLLFSCASAVVSLQSCGCLFPAETPVLSCAVLAC